MAKVLALSQIEFNTWYDSRYFIPPDCLQVLISWEDGAADTDSLHKSQWTGYEIPVTTPLYWCLPALPKPVMYDLLTK